MLSFFTYLLFFRLPLLLLVLFTESKDLPDPSSSSVTREKKESMTLRQLVDAATIQEAKRRATVAATVEDEEVEKQQQEIAKARELRTSVRFQGPPVEEKDHDSDFEDEDEKDAKAEKGEKKPKDPKGSLLSFFICLNLLLSL
jgi:hypothetical protein